MLEKIKTLEQQSSLLEPSTQIMEEWDLLAQKYAHNFINNIHSINAFNHTNTSEITFTEMEEKPTEFSKLLEQISKKVDIPGLNPASGGHLGYIPGGGVYPTAIADYLTDVFNKYAGIFFAGPGAVKLENHLIRWMCSIIGFNQKALGNLTSGGSIAALIAIVTARDAKQITPEKIRKSVIYLTKQVHHSAQKAIRIAGLEHAELKYIPTDSHFRMDIKSLENQIETDIKNGLTPFLIIASAGTTDTGAIDPLEKIASICEKHAIWFHVDAAYGGFFMLIDEEKYKFKGIEKADSVVIDPHKGLFLAYGTGAVLIKDVHQLHQSHKYVANYMQDAIEDLHDPSPAELSPELTKNFRGLRMWLPLKLFGLNAYKSAIEEKLWLCRYFYNEIQKLGFVVGPQPDLSVAIYRFVPEQDNANDFNLKLVNEVQKDGRVFLSSTTIDEVVWLRIAVLSFRSHISIINLTLEILKEKMEALNPN